jgi:hypothetical protein
MEMTMTEVLEREPWLAPYVDEADVDLEAARARYREGQRTAERSIPPRTRLVRDGMRTTSYAS